MTPEEAKTFYKFHGPHWLEAPRLLVWEDLLDEEEEKLVLEIPWDEVGDLELEPHQYLVTDPVLSVATGEYGDSPCIMLLSSQSTLDVTVYPIKSEEEVDNLIDRLLELKTSTFGQSDPDVVQ